MGGLGYRHFGRLQRRVQILGGSEKYVFVIFVRCAFVGVFVICLSLVPGGLLVLITQNRSLFLVMLRQCFSDFTIQPKLPRLVLLHLGCVESMVGRTVDCA